MRKSAFTKFLENLESDELKEELLLLYDKVPGVKAYYKMELGTDEERAKLYIGIKKQITSCYATRSLRRPRRPRIRKVQSILSLAKKDAIYDYELADVYLFNTEKAIEFMTKYGFYSEALSNTIRKSFEKAIHLIKLSLTEDMFRDRIKAITSNIFIDLFVRNELILLAKDF